MNKILVTLTILFSTNLYANQIDPDTYPNHIKNECKTKIAQYINQNERFNLNGCDSNIIGGNCDDIIEKEPTWIAEYGLLGFSNDGYRCRIEKDSKGIYKINDDIVVVDVNG